MYHAFRCTNILPASNFPTREQPIQSAYILYSTFSFPRSSPIFLKYYTCRYPGDKWRFYSNRFPSILRGEKVLYSRNNERKSRTSSEGSKYLEDTLFPFTDPSNGKHAFRRTLLFHFSYLRNSYRRYFCEQFSYSIGHSHFFRIYAPLQEFEE